MNKKIMAFGDIENGKRKFHHRKNLILLNTVDTEKNASIYHGCFRRKQQQIFYRLQR